MTKRKLRVLAGPQAYKQIQEQGLKQEDITAMFGASGGPKWFILSKLDEYLSQTFFAQRDTPVQLLGSSAGAWRFACYAQNNPAQAIEKFAQLYSHTVYEGGLNRDSVTHTTQQLTEQLLPESAQLEVLESAKFKLNFTVARSRHLLKFDAKPMQYAGLASAALSNMLSRDLLQLYYQRITFHSGGENNPFYNLPGFNTQDVRLNRENLMPALRATGAIPLVIHSEKQIAGAGIGPFQDGGIIDYHFDLKLNTPGLVLYPHFYADATPGWFDKPLKSRRTDADTFANVVMLCPSEALISSLPFAKISDRKDFEQMADKPRIAYWQKVIAAGQQMADEFHELLETGNWESVLEAI